VAFINLLVDQIPVRVPKALPKKRYINYFVITFNGDSERMILLNKRSGIDIWKNLFDFPSVETEEEMDPSLLIKTAALPKKLTDNGASCREISKTYTHLLTHQRLIVKFLHYQLTGSPGLQFLEVPISKIHHYPIPRLIDRFLNDHKLI
jgi:A/G-specific adenine glycosylase